MGQLGALTGMYDTMRFLEWKTPVTHPVLSRHQCL